MLPPERLKLHNNKQGWTNRPLKEASVISPPGPLLKRSLKNLKMKK
jgi:hypothetical protein